ncbi:MAG: invasion associated locus B family protein [Paracoccaceae bacterium]
MTLPKLTALLALAALAQSAAAQDVQEVVTGTYGDWDIRCATDPEANREVCVMHQVGKGPAGNDVLEVRVRKLDGVQTNEGQTVPAAIQIAAPLGVLLRSGVRVQVDGNQTRAAGFEICVPGRCLVRDAMTTDFLNEMKRGSTARMTVVSPQQGEVTVNVSLSGFTAAFNNLNP